MEEQDIDLDEALDEDEQELTIEDVLASKIVDDGEVDDDFYPGETQDETKGDFEVEL